MQYKYATHVPHLEEWDLLTWTEKLARFNKQYENSWRGRDYVGLEPLVEKLDAFLESKGLQFKSLLSLKSIISWYNIETNFADFADSTTIRSIVSGFGGSGGQQLPYHLSEDGFQCYQPHFVGGDLCPHWDKCDYKWFATHFGTEDQWKLIYAMGQ